MIDFSTLQGLTIPEGVVTQITDASGRVLWAVQSGSTAILEVAKITSQTAAGETTYSDEEFILLDIYPKTNGTVKVTYGGLTKTITDTSGAEEPNAQQVFFGTFNGVSDSVETPSSGTLTIEGNFYAYGVGVYAQYANKDPSAYCSCITNVVEWGDITAIPVHAFHKCSVAFTSLPNSITSIGAYAFYYCSSVNILTIPEGVTSIGDYAFYMDSTNLGSTYSPTTEMTNETITLPSTIQSLGFGIWSYDEDDEDNFYINTLILLATTPPSVNGSALADSRGLLESIIVPKGCGDTYKEAPGWNQAGWVNVITEAS